MTGPRPPADLASRTPNILKVDRGAVLHRVYSSRHDPQELYHARFDDALPVVREIDREIDLDGDWFWDLADVYRVGRPPR